MHTNIEKRKAVKALEKGMPIAEILELFNISRETLAEWKAISDKSKAETKNKQENTNSLPDMDFRKLLGCG